jgi:CRISPR/Cas system CSM-associated protein Csm2 small subunit
MPGIKGKTNNPKGRPPAGEAFIEQLRVAISEVAIEKKKTLMRHAVERAYTEDSVLIAMLKKLIPDLTETDLNIKTFEHFMKEKNKYGA